MSPITIFINFVFYIYQNYHLITVRILFIHKTIGCVHQTDQGREQGIQPYLP